MKTTFTWKIGGEAGFGIKVSCMMFVRLCVRMGLHIFDYSEYPSLIRGGHNTYQVTVSPDEVFAELHEVDYLVALNEETVRLHANELTKGATIVYDPDVVHLNEADFQKQEIALVGIPLKKIVKEVGGSDVMRNMVAIGATIALLCAELTDLEELIREQFAKKGEVILNQNLEMVRRGYAFVNENYKRECVHVLQKQDGQPRRMALTANDAISLGAVAAGCKLYAAYPMTPASSVLETLARWDTKAGIVVKHAEDEISVINMALGASFAGVRSMLGTSGGGFSLMVETLGLAGITETPLVIHNAQRPGPATGLPTWTGQGDLRFVMHAAQDDFPRIVLAPGDVDEAFELTRDAFFLAEKYQVPVIILTDKFLSESQKSTVLFELKSDVFERQSIVTQEQLDSMKESYMRYALTESGVSPRTLPGMPGGVHLANSDEHNEYGFTDETSAMRTAQHAKRMKKLDAIAEDIPEQKFYGPETADLTLIAWGSTKGTIREAMRILESENIHVNFLHLSHLFPFPAKQVKKVMKHAKRTLLVEGNAAAQLGGLIQQYTLVAPDETFLKYDGRPFFPYEVVRKVKELL